MTDERMASIQPQLGFEAFESRDLIIQAAFESVELKKEICGAIDKIDKKEHFFSPANVTRPMEIVRGCALAQRAGGAPTDVRRAGLAGMRTGLVGSAGPFQGCRTASTYSLAA
jgi:hypothetical protein